MVLLHAAAKKEALRFSPRASGFYGGNVAAYTLT
jgi:hypothetical protein